jgi:hypothetical protein
MVSTPSRPSPGSELLPCPFCGGKGRLYQRQNAAALAKEPEASGGLCAVASHAVRVGAASADLPATSEHMDVTAGETAPSFGVAQASGVREALELAEDVLSRAPFSTGIWPNGMHPNTGIKKIRNAISSLSSTERP